MHCKTFGECTINHIGLQTRKNLASLAFNVYVISLATKNSEIDFLFGTSYKKIQSFKTVVIVYAIEKSHGNLEIGRISSHLLFLDYQ